MLYILVLVYLPMDVPEQFFDSVVVFLKESNLTRGKKGHELV